MAARIIMYPVGFTCIVFRNQFIYNELVTETTQGTIIYGYLSLYYYVNQPVGCA